MAKETKIGLIVVLALAVTFGVVLVRRVFKSSSVSAGAIAAEQKSAQPSAPSGTAATTATDTVVISAQHSSEASGSQQYGIDHAVPHQAHRGWDHAHDDHPRHAADADDSGAGQAFLPRQQTGSGGRATIATRPTLDGHDHSAHAAHVSEPRPAVFQATGQTAPPAAAQETPLSPAVNSPLEQRPRYPVVEPEPVHESNYRQDAGQPDPPSYRDSSYEQSPAYEQSPQQFAESTRAGDGTGFPAPHMQAQAVDYASHRQQHAHSHQQHAHPTPRSQHPVGQFSGHAHGQQLPSERPTAEGGVYVVRPNDTFWTIAENVYGAGDYFKALIEHNRQHHPLPDRLAVGDKVLAPPLQELVQNHPDLCPKQRRPATAISVTSGATIRRGRDYVIREGDTLFDIARFEMGDASRWVEIYNLNKQLMTADFDYLKPGTQIALPARGRGPVDRTAQQPDPVRLR